MDTERTERLKRAFTELGRLAQARRLKQGDPLLHTRVFVDTLQQALDTESVAIQVAHSALLLEEPVTSVTDQAPSSLLLCHALHATGLRSLWIDADLSEADATRLAELLGRDWLNRAKGDPDLLAVFAEEPISTVILDILPPALAQETDAASGATATVQTLAARLGITDPQAENALGQGLKWLHAAAERAARWRPYQEEGVSAAAHPRAFERLHQQLEAVREDVDVSEMDLNRVMFEALRAARDEEDVFLLVERIARHVQRALREGRIEALRLLHRPLLLLEEDLFPDWPLRDTLQSTFRVFATEEMWDALVEGLAAAPEADWKGALFTLASALPTSYAGQVASAASRLSRRDLEQAVADGLVAAYRRAGRPLREVLLTAPEAGQRVALLAMARSTDATVVEALLSRFASEDPEVREAALVALRKQQSPRIKETARQALSDPVESVRLEALRYLAVYRDAEGAALIALKLSAATPGECSRRELKALALALVRIRPAEAVATLKALALQPQMASNPALAAAVLEGLFASGSRGATALDEVGMGQPALRPQIRALLGGRQ